MAPRACRNRTSSTRDSFFGLNRRCRTGHNGYLSPCSIRARFIILPSLECAASLRLSFTSTSSAAQGAKRALGGNAIGAVTASAHRARRLYLAAQGAAPAIRSNAIEAASAATDAAFALRGSAIGAVTASEHRARRLSSIAQGAARAFGGNPMDAVTAPGHRARRLQDSETVMQSVICLWKDVGHHTAVKAPLGDPMRDACCFGHERRLGRGNSSFCQDKG